MGSGLRMEPTDGPFAPPTVPQLAASAAIPFPPWLPVATVPPQLAAAAAPPQFATAGAPLQLATAAVPPQLARGLLGFNPQPAAAMTTAQDSSELLTALAHSHVYARLEEVDRAAAA